MFYSKLPGATPDIPNLQAKLKSKPENYWEKRGEKMALRLFHNMAERVPAYSDFLNKNGINHKKIKKIQDFKSVPPVDKDNYLRQYERNDLCWDGEFKKDSWVISSTSGSTGEPFYFPRQTHQDRQYADIAELYLRENYGLQDKSTLYIVAFPMGAWIGGVFTYQALQMVAERKPYNLSIITPGVHKGEILNAFKNLADDFDQVIIGSYGPFLKDIIDDGIRDGIDWKKYNLGFILSAEVVSETFRDYVAKKTGIDILKGSLNHYGTVDLGTMAHETPLSIQARRHAVKNAELYRDLFGDIHKLPTLAQYLPEMFYFEEYGGNLYCTAQSGIPLVRYDLKDHGGLLTYREVQQLSENKGIDLLSDLKQAGCLDTVWNLPFVYVYERNDFSVSFFAFQVYPETIRRALQLEDLEDEATGKFTMEVVYDDDARQRLTINVELMAAQKKSKKLENKIQKAVQAQLLQESSEYREVYRHYGSEVNPEIRLWTYEDPAYFRPGAKQQWVKKADKNS